MLVFSMHAAPFDVDRLVGVDQDVADGRILQQRLERAEAEDFVEHFLGEAVALGGAERDALLADQLLDDAEELLLCGACLLDDRASFSRSMRLISSWWTAVLISCCVLSEMDFGSGVETGRCGRACSS